MDKVDRAIRERHRVRFVMSTRFVWGFQLGPEKYYCSFAGILPLLLRLRGGKSFSSWYANGTVA
jgi:hypothetical protein